MSAFLSIEFISSRSSCSGTSRKSSKVNIRSRIPIASLGSSFSIDSRISRAVAESKRFISSAMLRNPESSCLDQPQLAAGDSGPPRPCPQLQGRTDPDSQVAAHNPCARQDPSSSAGLKPALHPGAATQAPSSAFVLQRENEQASVDLLS